MLRGIFWAAIFSFIAIVLGTQLNKLSTGAVFFFVGGLAGSLNEISISCRKKEQIGLEVVAWGFVLTGLILMAASPK